MTILHTQIHRDTVSHDLANTVLNTKEAAKYLRLSASTLNRWRCYGTGPKYLKLGRAVRYQQNELDAYLATRLKRSTVDTGMEG